MHVVARSPASGEGRNPPMEACRGAEALPHGFVPIDAMKSLPLMGRWAALPDGMPPWLPFHALVELAGREQAGDDEARAWLELYRHAVQGEREAQRAMGRACEEGHAGLAPDRDRAFFWYYRAGLAGDEAATELALRLKEAFDIAAAAMQEPALVYPGQWRLKREDREGTVDQLALELRDDGRIAGAFAQGLWSFDRAHRVLTLAHRETWRVRVLACRESLLFGRDARGAGCTLERVGPVNLPA